MRHPGRYLPLLDIPLLDISLVFGEWTFYALRSASQAELPPLVGKDGKNAHHLGIIILFIQIKSHTTCS